MRKGSKNRRGEEREREEEGGRVERVRVEGRVRVVCVTYPHPHLQSPNFCVFL